MNRTFKITFFLEQSIKELEAGLKGLGFKRAEKALVWKVEDRVFEICPFAAAKRYNDPYGYRVYFNGTVSGGLYLFDLSIALYRPQVIAVECESPFGDKTRQEWVRHFKSLANMQDGPMEGTFRWKGINIMVTDRVIFMLRAKQQKTIKIVECVKKIKDVQAEMMPERFDLFSVGD